MFALLQGSILLVVKANYLRTYLQDLPGWGGGGMGWHDGYHKISTFNSLTYIKKVIILLL